MTKRRINLRAIIWRDGKIFAVKHFSERWNGPAEYWALPGGGLDDMESLDAGIKREIIEETGVEPVVERIILGQQFKSKRQGYDEELELFYLVSNADDFNNINLAKTTHGAAEIAEYGFIDPKTELIKPEFLSTIDLTDYVQNVRPVYIADKLSK
ncbi:NUDIX hydrolase [Candidatus Saccharibacteria bacterium]|jgi:ADP-ribose pyrophosphatase YjhB (NUDIX family)|nr:NUDIX hydrolase [Candidatus Saccharibacteria bacterium]